VDELIVTDSDFGERELLEIVDHAHRRGVEVRIAPKATELLTSRVEFVPGQGIPLFELRPPAFIGMDWVVKRSFDLVVSGLVLIVGTPVWLTIAAAVKLNSRGPVFYRDRRVGLGEQEFGMLKFRTMRADAAGQQAELESSNEADGPLFKIREDPRVTNVGAFLRRFSLDEIPQLWNVLRGEMSLVGPRPESSRFVDCYPHEYERILSTRPGILGLSQLAFVDESRILDERDPVRHYIEEILPHKVELDLLYVERHSVWFDLRIILWSTVAVLLRRPVAVEPATGRVRWGRRR
jgi:lipopolysaccharide/colanic/teichoic acid biosynthesis glycosyltransferase